MKISKMSISELHAKMASDLFFATVQGREANPTKIGNSEDLPGDVSIHVKLRHGKHRKLTFRWVKTWEGKMVIGVNYAYLSADMSDADDELFYQYAIDDTTLEGFTAKLAELLAHLGAECGLEVEAGEIETESGTGYDRYGDEEPYFSTRQTNMLFLNGVLILTYDFWTDTYGSAARFKKIPRNCITGWEEDKYVRTDEGFMHFFFVGSNQSEPGDRKNPMKEIYAFYDEAECRWLVGDARG